MLDQAENDPLVVGCRQPLPNRVTSELLVIRPESMPSAEITFCKPTSNTPCSCRRLALRASDTTLRLIGELDPNRDKFGFRMKGKRLEPPMKIISSLYFAAFLAVQLVDAQVPVETVQPQQLAFEQKLREVRYDLRLDNGKIVGKAASVLESAIGNA